MWQIKTKIVMTDRNHKKKNKKTESVCKNLVEYENWSETSLTLCKYYVLKELWLPIHAKRRHNLKGAVIFGRWTLNI